MKLGPVTELDKINTVPSRNFTMVSCQELSHQCPTYGKFAVNPEAGFIKLELLWFIKLIFSLTITFYLMKTENKTTKPQTQL